MPKKELNNNHNNHPNLKVRLTIGQKAADRLAEYAGSWLFILGLIALIILWMLVNIYGFINQWDPYPFILLNLGLSCLAALQAPVILMSQNRQAERDRVNARYDYRVNRKAEREIQEMIRHLHEIKKRLK